MDGAGVFSIFWSIVLPMAAAVLMTIPVAVVFFIFQRKIMNASAGAVKE